MQLAVGNEHAVIVVDRDAIDQAKRCFETVANEGGVSGLGVENEERSDLLVRYQQLRPSS